MLCTFALMSVCVCLLQHSRNFSMPHCEENLCKDVTFGIENIPSDQMRLNTSVGGKKCRWLTCVVSWHNVGRTGKEGGCSFSVRQSWVCCVYKKKQKKTQTKHEIQIIFLSCNIFKRKKVPGGKRSPGNRFFFVCSDKNKLRNNAGMCGKISQIPKHWANLHILSLALCGIAPRVSRRAHYSCSNRLSS